MSANDANLNKVKKMSSDSNNPAPDSDAPEKGGATFDSANIKSKDQSEMFVKVEGSEQRAKAEARKAAAQKKEEAKEAAEEAAEARREAKEEALINAAKKDAAKAKAKAENKIEHREELAKKRKRTILITVGAVIAIVVAIILACVIKTKLSDSKYKKYMKESIDYLTIVQYEMTTEGSGAEQKISQYKEKIESQKDDEGRLAYCISYLGFINQSGWLEKEINYVKGCYGYAKTNNQKYHYLKSIIALSDRIDESDLEWAKSEFRKISNDETYGQEL